MFTCLKGLDDRTFQNYKKIHSQNVNIKRGISDFLYDCDNKRSLIKRKIVSVMFCKNVRDSGQKKSFLYKIDLVKVSPTAFSRNPCATYYSVKEWMLEAFANGDSLFGINHETFANQIFGIL